MLDDEGEEFTCKRGIIYLSTIPKFMNVTKLREIMEEFGEVGRVFLQPAPVKNGKKKVSKHFTEGWVEFKKKRVAKHVAEVLNNKQIGGKKRSKYYDCIWTIKYLSRFKWVHLTERLAYERAVHKQRMRVEVSQAKKEAVHFSNTVDRSERLKAKSSVVNVESISLPYSQRKTEKEYAKNKTVNKEDRSEFLRSIFS